MVKTDLLKPLFLGATFLLLTFTSTAQTPKEDLEKGVEAYNSAKTYRSGLKFSSLSMDEVNAMKTRMENGTALLDKVIQSGNSDQIKTARYFRSLFKYEYAFTLGMKGENTKMLEIFRETEDPIANYSSADFPLRYAYFDKNFVVTWENFAPTQAEFLSGYAEGLYGTGKYEDALRMSRKVLAHPYAGAWLKYITVNKILDIQGKNGSLITDKEHADYALQAIKTYHNLSDEDRETVKENNYPTIKRGVNTLLGKAQAGASSSLVAQCAEAAVIAAKYGADNNGILQLFEYCYRNNHGGDRDFNTSAERFARGFLPSDPARAKYVGLTALNRMALSVAAGDCAGLLQIADNYAQWKETSKENEYRKKHGACLAQAEKDRARAERIARKANRSGNFNFYAGAYLFPLMRSSDKRDYGGVVNFVFPKTAIEFSYLKINNNKENVTDVTFQGKDADDENISRWDGFYAHFQPKFFSKKTSAYTGVLLGYADKKFDQMPVNVISNTDGTLSTVDFKPSVKQFILMFNGGGLLLAKGVGVDLYMGLGVTYSMFDAGTSIDRENYNIQNNLLENRKDDYFGVIFRVGMTAGLNLGKGRKN